MSEWTPVVAGSEPASRVLVTVRNEEGLSVQVAQHDRDCAIWYDDEDLYGNAYPVNGTVTHWAPLPEPAQEAPHE